MFAATWQAVLTTGSKNSSLHCLEGVSRDAAHARKSTARFRLHIRK